MARFERPVRTLAVVVAALVLALTAGFLLVTALTSSDADNGQPSRSADEEPTRTPDSRPLVIAHRGASAYAPHDTVAAAQEAVKRNADVLEVDVRQTRDGRLVAMYTASLAPTTNVEEVFPQRQPWHVESFTLSEIRRLDAGSWFSPRFAGEKVPTLEEIADALGGSDLGLIVEIKSPDRYPGIADRVARLLRTHPVLSSGSDQRYVEVESFDWSILRRFERLTPGVTLGLSGTPAAGRLEEFRGYADAVNPQVASVDQGYIDRAHRLGLQVKVWSVNSRESMRRAVDSGVDGIYTKHPDVLNEVLAKIAGRR